MCSQLCVVLGEFPGLFYVVSADRPRVERNSRSSIRVVLQ
jgi:hypothetical protein